MGNYVITQEMREHVTVGLEEQLLLRKSGHEPVVFPDDMLSLMYSAADADPSATIDRIINETAFLLKEYCNRKTVREYLVLRPHFSITDDMITRITLLHGLHHPECNREPMKLDDPASIQRNTTLLKAVAILRHREKLSDKALAYFNVHTTEMAQGFRDERCAELVIEHPNHHELLIQTMLERGYEEGIEVFKNMMAAHTPALVHGTL